MKKFLLLLTILTVISCNQNRNKAAEPTQMQHVLAIHDELMAQMKELGKLTGQLKAKVDTTAVGIEYETAVKDLQAANTAMMDWMMGFGDRFDSGEIMNGKALSPQKQEWLNEEEEKVLALQEQFNLSIANAKELLGKE